MVVFNSAYHRQEFLASARDLLASLPAAGLVREPRDGTLRIMWNHRWSQDKDPEALFAALGELVG